LEGNDTFFIASTSETVALEVVGGLGGDTFNVGGSNGDTVTVVSNSLQGHGGVVINTVSSNDPRYQAIFVQDVVGNVGDNDEAGVIVMREDGPLRVFESVTADSGLIVYTYKIVLTRAPEETVRITAAPVPLSESDERAGGAGIRLNGSDAGVTLQFDRNNWFIAQTITVTAVDDQLAEGRRSINIQHTVVEGATVA